MNEESLIERMDKLQAELDEARKDHEALKDRLDSLYDWVQDIQYGSQTG